MERESAWSTTDMRTESGARAGGRSFGNYTGNVPRAEHRAAVRQYHVCFYYVWAVPSMRRYCATTVHVDTVQTI